MYRRHHHHPIPRHRYRPHRPHPHLQQVVQQASESAKKKKSCISILYTHQLKDARRGQTRYEDTYEAACGHMQQLKDTPSSGKNECRAYRPSESQMNALNN